MVDFFFDFVAALLQVMEFIGMLGGLLFYVAFVWLVSSRRGRKIIDGFFQEEEYRCSDCTISGSCMAAEAGVLYPCPGFERKKDRC